MAIITISREVGSLGTEIAKKVKDDLGLNFLNKVVLEKELIDRYGLTSKNVELYDEKKPSLWDFSLDRERHLHDIKSAMYEFALKGNCIMIGRGGQVLFKDFPEALHIRVTAPYDIRVKRIMARYSCSEKIAERIIRQSDHDREGYHKFFFYADWNDPKFYDLIINTKKVTVDAAAKMISAIAENTGILKKNQDETERLSNICLGNEVIMKIRYIEKVNLYYLDVEASNGTVTLKGIASFEDDTKKCAEIAGKVPGVKKVINEIAVFEYPQF